MPVSEVLDIKTNLKSGHPLHTLMAEHELILEFLDKLEKINVAIQKTSDFKEQKEFADSPSRSNFCTSATTRR